MRASVSQEDLQLRIVLETDELVVVDKPWGIPSTGRRLNDPDSLQYALMQRYVSMTWAVHQLDADTSGLNVFVRRRGSVKHWQARMRYPNGHKTYLAVVHGRMDRDTIVDSAIGIVRAEPSKCLGVTPNGRPARSRFEILHRNDDLTLAQVHIETGRTHQIRIHAASIGHPLVGETWYRDEPCRRHCRQALHAWRLRFCDGEEPSNLSCPPPRDLLELLRRERLCVPGVDPAAGSRQTLPNTLNCDGSHPLAKP